MKSDYKQLNPLQVAIVDGNSDLVLELKDSKYAVREDVNGFSPLELADLLGKNQIQKLLSSRKPKSIKLQLEGKSSPELISVAHFEKIFNITYRHSLTFSTYDLLTEVVQSCPYFFRLQSLFGKNDDLETLYLDSLYEGKEAKTVIKWIDPIIKYGLFADSDLTEKTFIGEYTGNVRKIHTNDLASNAYCFYYTTKAFSSTYFAIDALNEGNHLRFINHSDTPNLTPLWLLDKGLLHLCLITNQAIKRGSELTFNYGKDYWRHRTKKEF